MVTVATELDPPGTVDGARDRLTRPGELIVRFAVWTALPRVAVIGAMVADETASVLMGNVALTFPARTVTDAGTEALDDVVESATTAPAGPAGPAGPARNTVPAEGRPPTTVPGFKLRPVSPEGVIVSGPAAVLPLNAA
jgi:hypothetical protein